MWWMVAAAAGVSAIWVLLIAASIRMWGLRWAVRHTEELTEHLKSAHPDWAMLRATPRYLLVFLSDREPVQLLGSNPEGHHVDVPAKGTWVLAWPFCIAATTKTGRKFRLPGLRWDYNARVYVLTFRFT